MDAAGKALAVRAVVEERQGLAGARASSRAPSAGSISIRASVTGSSDSSTTAKKEVFGCQNCGNCVLGSMEYVCPQTCPEADAQRPVRRNVPRRVRSHRPGVHLGEGDGARRSVQHDRPVEGVHSAARSHADRHGVVGQLLSRSRQPARTSEGSLEGRRGPGPHGRDRRRRSAQDRRAVGGRQGAGRRRTTARRRLAAEGANKWGNEAGGTT